MFSELLDEYYQTLGINIIIKLLFIFYLKKKKNKKL